MRDIEFRGKSVRTGEWRYGAFVPYSKHMSYIYGDYVDKDEVWEVSTDTVGQFTGLLDKNGKEIFEWDIIKVTGEFAIDDYGIVKWSQQEDDYTYHCGFMVDWQEEVKRRSHLSFWANHREIEIIGNIYENPELLEEEQK